jgi:hypothetical protein
MINHEDLSGEAADTAAEADTGAETGAVAADTGPDTRLLASKLQGILFSVFYNS